MNHAQRKAIKAAVEKRVSKEQACNAERKHRAWRRRMVFIACVIAASGGAAWLYHWEVAHEAMMVSIDGFVACTIDKFIFGIAEV